MRKLALSEDILMQVDKPARYIGNELNSVMKDPSEVAVSFVMCFPDVYEVGMSHQGIQILYDMYNREEGIYCERLYSPWPDLHKIMKERNIPLFTLETQTAVRDKDFLGITIQYEMCYTNILQILDLSQIPLLAKDRGEEDPIVVGGGPCTYNPEPIALFFDMFFLGEGEVNNVDVVRLYERMKKEGVYSREDFLHEAAKFPGVYVPAFFTPVYQEDGTLEDWEVKYDDIPSRVRRQVMMDMDHATYPVHPIVPFVRSVQDRVVIEIMRGCIRGCRFCQAGMVYRPTREKSLATLKSYVEEMLSSSGYDEISLSSLSSSDYRGLSDFLDYLIEKCDREKINISLPSLRIDAFSLDVMSKIQDVRKSSVTFAPEAGSQRMRDVINKGISLEEIMSGAKEAFHGGWNKLKLYFMLGLPTETDEDIMAIPRLGNDLAALYFEEIPKDQRNGRAQITMSTSFFVPKPFTPFQWAPMHPPEDYIRRARLVKDTMHEQLNRKSLHYEWHHPQISVLEGIFARGDRKVADAILWAYTQKGQIYDAWSEYFNDEVWQEAFDRFGISADFYAYRQRPLDEIFPWDFIDCGLTRPFLEREWKNAMAGKLTPNCRDQCSGCGMRSMGGGVCFENQNPLR